MKNRSLLIVGWFALQFLFNFLTKTEASSHLVSRIVFAAAYFLAPIQIIIDIAVVVAILKWKKKALIVR
jgi:hypothetical protein